MVLVLTPWRLLLLLLLVRGIDQLLWLSLQWWGYLGCVLSLHVLLVWGELLVDIVGQQLRGSSYFLGRLRTQKSFFWWTRRQIVFFCRRILLTFNGVLRRHQTSKKTCIKVFENLSSVSSWSMLRMHLSLLFQQMLHLQVLLLLNWQSRRTNDFNLVFLPHQLGLWRRRFFILCRYWCFTRDKIVSYDLWMAILFCEALKTSAGHHLHLVLAQNSLFYRLLSWWDRSFRWYLLAHIKGGLLRWLASLHRVRLKHELRESASWHAKRLRVVDDPGQCTG